MGTSRQRASRPGAIPRPSVLILSWNVRGLNNGGKLCVVRDYTRRLKCKVICLLEHKIKKDVDCLVSEHWNLFDVASNLSSDLSRRIIVLWNRNRVTLTPIMETSQLIYFEALSPTKPDFFLTAVYGANDTGARRQLWSDLINLHPNGPWIITGDFNCIRYNAEK